MKERLFKKIQKKIKKYQAELSRQGKAWADLNTQQEKAQDSADDLHLKYQKMIDQDYAKYLNKQAAEEQKLSNQEAVLKKQFDDRVASNAAGIQTLKVRMTGLTDEQLRLINAGERLNGIQSMTNVDQQAKAIRSLTADMNAASRGTNTFAATLQYMTERFIQIGMYVAIFRKLTSAISDMIGMVSSLDKSLVELRKVTDMTDSQLESFTKTAFEIGDTVARTGQDVIDAAAIFKRSGYEINESLDLSKAAMTMMNVGDNIDTVSDAATTLISVLKGYNLEADKAIAVTSLINEVSNTSAINFADLSEGLTRTSAVFNQSGVSMENLAGLLTGTNEVLQNIEKSSTGLITISQRLRAVTDVGEDGYEGISKLSKEFKKYSEHRHLRPANWATQRYVFNFKRHVGYIPNAHHKPTPVSYGNGQRQKTSQCVVFTFTKLEKCRKGGKSCNEQCWVCGKRTRKNLQIQLLGKLRRLNLQC